MSHYGASPVRLTVVHNADAASLGRWAHWPGAELRTVVPDIGDLLPCLGDIGDGLVVLGGPYSAYDDEQAPWLPGLRALLAQAVAEDVPVVGIGLGAQLLAVATGGQVEVDAPPGFEVGATSIFWRAEAAADPVLARAVALAERDRSLAVSMHADAIVELPERATWLASSNQYPFQAFRVGSALGLQFHAEADRKVLATWCEQTPGIDAGQVLARFDEHAGQIAATSRALAEGFVAAIRES